MPTPTWLAASTGSAGQAGQVNQFLSAHAVTYVYQGALGSSRTTAGSGAASANGVWLAQSFTTTASQTAIGYVVLSLGYTNSPAPWAVSIQASSGGAPSGTPLVSVSLPKELALIPGTAVLPVTGLSPSTAYWIVGQAGTSVNYVNWNKSNQASGASTSANGTTWAAQAYGLVYAVYDQSLVLPLAGTWEDSGARWTWLSYTSGQLTGIAEYTAGQAANGYAVSNRALSYSGGLLTGVA